MENYKELLTALYKEHAPEKIDQIDFYLERYKGKEKQFYITQKAKYANKKSVKDSKKILEEAMDRIKKKGETTDIKSPANIEKKKTEVKTEPVKKEEKPLPKAETLKEEKTKKEEEKTVETESKPIQAVSDSKKHEKKVEINPPIKKPESSKTIVEEKKTKEETAPVIVDTTSNIQDKKPEHDIDQPSNNPKKEKPATIKDEKEKIKQENWEIQREKLRKTKDSNPKKEKKKAPVFWYFGVAAVIILLVALAVWFLHFRDIDKKKDEPINVQKVKVENKEVSTSKKDTQEVQQNTASDKQQVKEAEEPKTDTRPKNQKPPSQTSPAADRIYAKDINKPAIFVGCFATKTENQAQKKLAVLKQYGLDAHYYWIPDLDPDGNQYFKVVAGPFNSIADAYPSLTKAQEKVNFDSYILIIE